MGTLAVYFGSVHLLFYIGDKVLLLRRANTGYEDGKWGVVAGKIENGEDVVSAAIREAKEEAGVNLANSDIQMVGIIQRKAPDSEWIDFFLKITHWVGEIKNAEPDKCSEMEWFDRNALPEGMISFIKDAIIESNQQIWFKSFGW